MTPRWFNAQIISDKIWKAKNNGWEHVRVEDVRDLSQIGGYNKSPEGYITRGERGQEYLMCMPTEWVNQIAQSKVDRNLGEMRNPNKTKANVIQAASEKLGDQGASYLDRHLTPVGNVVDTIERLERTDPE